MYDKRIKIFVILSALLLLICLLRLMEMQLLPDSSLQDDIAELKRQRGLSRQLKTTRGKILDRNGEILATDEPRFQLRINYRLSSVLDERIRRAKLLRAGRKQDANPSLPDLRKQLEAELEDLQQIIDKCTYFGLEREDIEERIKNINDRIWNLRVFVAWVRKDPAPAILEKYNHKINSVPLSVAIADFEKKFPNQDQRLELVSKVDDIAEMDENWPFLELRTDDDIFVAQLEFLDVDGIQILPKAQRFYPFGSVAAQTIGWVGPAKGDYQELFADDKLSSYLEDEVCGKRPGVEYVCEAILRGRRGQEEIDIDRQLKIRTEPQFGRDVSLTLDIELQKKIEDYLADGKLDPNCKAPTAAAVIEVATGDILALVSMPVFDLNRIRRDYDVIARDPNESLRNRAINKQYPPGSVVKPLILIAGLESGVITPDEVIGCPAQKAPTDWPSCWLYNRYSWMGHDNKWENKARNAIKGSCNIYFSRLADRINPSVLQQGLFKFGYGRNILLAGAAVQETRQQGSRNARASNRNLKQVSGIISSSNPEGTISRVEQVPPLKKNERRFFGIGQGNLRVTPLHVANAMAAIARGGIFKQPQLLKEIPSSKFEIRNSEGVALGISAETLEVVYDGMRAVVNEPGGTAYKEFAHSGLAEQGIEVYGKTGSTEKPENAWFAGFATDNAGRSIAIAVLVEGGQRGSADAAPLARDIIQFCIDAGYIGQAGLTTRLESNNSD